MRSRLVEVGNALEGVNSEGKKLPQSVQEAIAEVEQREFNEEGVQALKLVPFIWRALREETPAAQDALTKERIQHEIVRQKHFDEVVTRMRKENGC
jgi:hypothetical protein